MNNVLNTGLVTIASAVGNGAQIAFVVCDGHYFVSAVRGETELYGRYFDNSARAATAYARLEAHLKGRNGRFISSAVLSAC